MEYMLVRLGEWWKTGPCKPRHWKWYMVNYISSMIYGSQIITYDLWNYSPTKSLSRTLQQKRSWTLRSGWNAFKLIQSMFSIKILEIASSHKQHPHAFFFWGITQSWLWVGGHWEEALQLLQNMHEAKVHPNVAPWQLMQRAMVGGCGSSNGKKQSHWNVLYLDRYEIYL